MKRTPPPNSIRWTSIALVSVGLLMIFLGWNGAAGADAAVDLRAQFPYLISGGIFGVALVGAGLVLVLIAEARKDSQAIVRQLEALTVAVERLADTAALSASPPPPEDATVDAVPADAVPAGVGTSFEAGR